MNAIDLLSDEFRRTTDEVYPALHDSGELAFDARTGAYYVWGREPAHSVLTDHDTFASGLRQPPARSIYGAATMIFTDPPGHGRLRKAFGPFLAAKAVHDLDEELDRHIADMLERGLASGDFDAMALICRPLPVIAICNLVGIPTDRWSELEAWSNAVVEVSGGPDGARRRRSSARSLRTFFADLARDEGQPDPQVASAHRSLAATGLTDDEVAAGLMLLLIAGHETTAGFLGNVVHLLATHPHLLEIARSDPDAFVDEALRLVGPVLALRRITTRPASVGDTPIPEGATVIVLPAAANRDPRVYRSPGTFDLDRASEPPALAFGFGIHRCAGARLALLEARKLARAIGSGLGEIRMRGDAVDYVRSVFVRRPVRLDVRATPRTRPATTEAERQ